MTYFELDLFKAAVWHTMFLHSVNALNLPKVLYKIWSGYTKFIRSNIHQGRSVHCSEFGKFVPLPSGSLQFLPSKKLGNFSVSPLSSDAKVPEIFVSNSLLSRACKLPEETVRLGIMEIAGQALKHAQSGVVLNFKVGKLSINGSDLQFSPLESATMKYVKTDIKQESPKIDRAEPVLAFYKGDSILFRSRNVKMPIQRLSVSPKEMRKAQEKEIEDARKIREGMRVKENAEIQANLRNIQNSLGKDRREAERRAREQQKKFVKGIGLQTHINKQSRLQEQAELRREKYDFFPFVYGDEVEKHRKELTEQRRKEDLAFKETLQKPRESITNPINGVPRFLTPDPLPVIKANQNVKEVMVQAYERYYKTVNDRQYEILQKEKEYKYQLEKELKLLQEQDKIDVNRIEKYKEELKQQIKPRIPEKKAIESTSLEPDPHSRNKVYQNDLKEALAKQIQHKKAKERIEKEKDKLLFNMNSKLVENAELKAKQSSEKKIKQVHDELKRGLEEQLKLKPN